MIKRNYDRGNLKLERIDKVLMNPVISGSAAASSRNGALPELWNGIFFNYDNIRFCGEEVANYNSLKVTVAAEAREDNALPKSEIENG